MAPLVSNQQGTPQPTRSEIWQVEQQARLNYQKQSEDNRKQAEDKRKSSAQDTNNLRILTGGESISGAGAVKQGPVGKLPISLEKGDVKAYIFNKIGFDPNQKNLPKTIENGLLKMLWGGRQESAK